MKKYISLILLVCLMVPFSSVFAQERERGPEFGLEMRRKIIDLEEQKYEVEMHQKMHELKYKEKEWEIEFYMRMQQIEIGERELELEGQRIEVDRLRKSLERGPEKKCGKGSCKGGGGPGKCGKGPGKSGGPCGNKSAGNSGAEHCVLFVLISFVTNILMAIWIYSDGRKRNAGNGIWIVITLLIGFFGILPYTIIRLGDLRREE